MVKSANMNGLLDSDRDSLTGCQQKVKARLHEIMQKDQDFTAEDYDKVCGNILELRRGLVQCLQVILRFKFKQLTVKYVTQESKEL